MITALSVVEPTAQAAADDFYAPAPSLPAGQNCDVVKTLPSTYTSRGGAAGGVSPSAPEGIAGSSQGGGTAAELASRYAPELTVVGRHAGFEGFTIAGVNAAYSELNLADMTYEQSKQALQRFRGYCTLVAVLGLAFKNSVTLTLDGRPVSAHLPQEPCASVIAAHGVFLLFAHALSASAAATDGANWFAAQFAGQTPRSNCGKF
ncbi:hypothetical protein [Amycolatopsis sp. H20-H5]|uniref:hypothetical protein n=1 Tax=Amycolatopsis sp. H20-H5 TaxID=3046309 RepID=UPI002DBA2FA3|nr:hypothetical protein [Amycolatopsis sp. H20-H5]